MKEKYEKPFWLWIIIFLYAIWCAVDNPLSNLVLVITLIIGWKCGNKCIEWATQIKKNKVIAFLIGYFFNLLGLLGYYIYYRNKIK